MCWLYQSHTALLPENKVRNGKHPKLRSTVSSKCPSRLTNASSSSLNKHTLTRSKVNCYRKFSSLITFQIIQASFILDMFISPEVSVMYRIIMVSEQCEIIFSCLLFQIRQHFRINPPLKQYFSVLSINYLATIIRKDITSIISEF